MHHAKGYIACFLIFNLYIAIEAENSTNPIDKVQISDIADTLVKVLNRNTNDTRTNELKNKLNKIKSYTIDKANYASLLKNVTAETDLNATDFYKSMQENDEFKFLTKDEPKHLYLRMKEKMNRDDVLEALTDKNKDSVINTARKVMDFDYFDKNEDEVLDTIVDKLIAEKPFDDHKFEAKESIYWDPQNELEELKENHNHDGRRIFKGQRATVRYYPFMASIHVMGRFWCGGAIYNFDLVLTSAACLQLMHNNRFFRENPRVLAVRVGSNHSRIGGELIDALEVYFHPGYNPRSLRNNLAIIRLRHSLKFTYHRVPKIIAISQNPGAVPNTAQLLVLGWGVTRMSQKMSYEPVYLQKKFLPAYPNTFCKEIYGDQFITSTMFCAGTFTTGEGACDHDAGGPAIMAGTLVGIISFGPTVCGYPNAPTVFTNVGAFADWIETVNETMPGYYRGRVRSTTTTRRPLLDHLMKKRLELIQAEQDAKTETPLEETTEATTTSTTEATTTTTEAETETTETTTSALRSAARVRISKDSDNDSWGD